MRTPTGPRRSAVEKSLEDLEVTVVVPPAPGAEDLGAAWKALLREAGSDLSDEARPRAEVGLEDEIRVDLVAFANSSVAPFASMIDFWLHEESDALYPGLRAALVGAQPGEQRWIDVRFPEAHPFEGLRGLQLICAVDVRERRPRVEMSEAKARLLAGGAREEDLLAALEQELHEDFEQEVSRRVEAAVLDEVAHRLGTEVEEWMVSAEISARWHALEQPILAATVRDPELLASSRNKWLEDPLLRGEVTSILRREKTLIVITEALNVTVSNEELGHFLVNEVDSNEEALALGADLDAAPPSERNALMQHLVLRKALELAVSRARVQVLEMQPEP